MLFLLVAIPVLSAITLLLLLGRLTAAGALLLVLLYVNFSDIGIRYHGWPSVAEPLVLVFAVTLFVRATRAGRSRSLGTCVGFWSAAAIYLAVVMASTIWAANSGAAAHQASDVAKGMLIVYVLAELFDTPGGQRLAIWALIGAGAALAGISVIQAITHTYGNSYLGLARAPVRQLVGSTNGYRSAGPLGDPDFYGLMLAALVPLAALRLRDERRPALRATALFSASLLIAGVGLTYSRGAVIALAAAAIALLVAVRIPARMLLVGAGLLLVLVAIAPSHYLQRLMSLGRVDHSFQGRVDSQYVALAMFADHPLLGVGADNYKVNYLPYVKQLHVPDAASTVHDLYLVAASETGLIGLVAFGCAMFAVLSRTWRRRTTALRTRDRAGAGLALGSFLALATYLVGALFLPLAYPRYLWLLVGVALSISLPSREVVAA